MECSAPARRVIIMGAAGRDFHNFNVAFRDNPLYEVVAFTAAQIPGISDRKYPAELAGPRYSQGIPIVEEDDLSRLIETHQVDEVVFAYSDVPHTYVMHVASIALGAGADFALLGPQRTMLVSRKPVIAICAVRTGAGKSQTTRWLARLIEARGYKPVIIRHPMPYGNLRLQEVQRFSSTADLDAAQCTVEEREEYEPHIASGNVVYAGVDYSKIVAAAESEADVILWDGGNNDFPFLKPELQIVLVDPLRSGHETTHHPGEAVLRTADIVVIAKTNSAADADVQAMAESASALAPRATIVKAASKVWLEDDKSIAGRRVLVVEDGPTITHGGMSYGAGYIAAIQAGAGEVVDPRCSAVGDIVDVYKHYPHIGRVLPAMGYSAKQLEDLSATINQSSADVVVTGTPSDLGHIVKLNKLVVRARYDFEDVGEPKLGTLVLDFLAERDAS